MSDGTSLFLTPASISIVADADSTSEYHRARCFIRDLFLVSKRFQLYNLFFFWHDNRSRVDLLIVGSTSADNDTERHFYNTNIRYKQYISTLSQSESTFTFQVSFFHTEHDLDLEMR